MDFCGTLTLSVMILKSFVYRFTSVIFDLISIPFLINGTLKLHSTKVLFKELYDSFIIEKLLRDLYVDNLVSRFNDENLLYKF